jgi:molybdenum cofactor biosynthesis enzyme MoaA
MMTDYLQRIQISLDLINNSKETTLIGRVNLLRNIQREAQSAIKEGITWLPKDERSEESKR